MGEISPALYRAGEGEPLVLLHGVTGTWHHWRPVLGELAARFEVIAPTLAGHSGGPPFEAEGPMTLGQATDHLERHLDELGVETAHVAGNSLGGALSLELAKRGRARSVVALSPGGGWRQGEPSGRRPGADEGRRLARFFTRTQRMTKASRNRLPAIMGRPGMRRLALRDVMLHGEHVPAAEAVHIARASIECTVIGRVIDALRKGVSIEDLDQVKAPTLVAWSQVDRVLPMSRHARRFREEIPGVEFRVLEGVGHIPMYDNPGLVAKTIAEFVERQVAGAKPEAALA